MEKEELTEENPEAITATRWILGIGLGGILLFVILSYLWFGLARNGLPPSSTLTPAATVLAVTFEPIGGTAVVNISPDRLSTSSLINVTPSISYSTVTGSATFPISTFVPKTTSYPADTRFLAQSTNFSGISTPTSVVANIPTDLPIYTPTDTTPLASTSAITDEPVTPTFTATPAVTPTPVLTALNENAVTPSVVDPLQTLNPAPASISLTAAQAFDQLQSMHFIIDVRAGKVEILPGTDLKRAEGDLSKPGSFQAKVLVHTFMSDFNIQTIGIGNDQYMTNPIGGNWYKLSASQSFNLSVLFDPQNGIGSLSRKMQNVRVLGTEDIDKVSCIHYTGTLPGSAIGPITLGTLGHNPVTLDVWAGRDDNLIRQLYLKETVTNGAFWVINLSRFNETLSIKKPIN